MRSATVDISQTYSQGIDSGMLGYTQSIDLSASNIAQKLQQLYGQENSPHRGGESEEAEIELFLSFKQQLFDMLTKGQKSQLNTKANMASIEGVQISRATEYGSPYYRYEDEPQKPYEPGR